MDAIQPARSLVERTYDALLEAICTGQFQPGERLSQDVLAERLQVSRQPVNSAIAMLKTQNFVQDTGRRGVVVAPISLEMLAAIYQFRSAVDPLAVELAIPRMDAAAARTGARILAAGRKAVESGTPQDALSADAAFHQHIYALSGNMMIRDAMQLNWRHLQRGMGRVLSNPGMTEAVWEEHAEIFAAMEAGEAGRASGLMRAHILNALERVLAS